MRLIVGQGIGLAMAGAVLGVAGALAATRVLRSLLFGVGAVGPGHARVDRDVARVRGDRGELDPGAAGGGGSAVGCVAGVVIGLKRYMNVLIPPRFARTANGRFVVARSAEER